MRLTKEKAEEMLDRANENIKEWRINGCWSCPHCGRLEARPQEHAPLGVIECVKCGWPRKGR